MSLIVDSLGPLPEFFRCDAAQKLVERGHRRDQAHEDLAAEYPPFSQHVAAEALANARTGDEWCQSWLTFREHALRAEAACSIRPPADFTAGGSSVLRGREAYAAYLWAELAHEVNRLDAGEPGVDFDESTRDRCWRIAELATELAWAHDRKAGER